MAAAAAIQVAPHENDMVFEMRGFAQRMIRVLAVTGSSAAAPDVLEFQRAWNRNLPIIRSLLQKLGQPTSAAVKLVEDGKYGPNTSYALCGIICGPGLSSKPPQRASGMPTWAASNMDYVNALSPPVPEPAGSVLNQPMPIPNGSSDASAAQDVLNSGGSAVRDVIPVSTPSGASPVGPPQVISTTTSHVPTGVPQPVAEVMNAPGPQTPIEQLTNEELAQLNVDTDFTGEAVNIVTSRPRSRVPWLAITVGGVTLSGLMYWWANRRKRRR